MRHSSAMLLLCGGILLLSTMTDLPSVLAVVPNKKCQEGRESDIIVDTAPNLAFSCGVYNNPNNPQKTDVYAKSAPAQSNNLYCGDRCADQKGKAHYRYIDATCVEDAKMKCDCVNDACPANDSWKQYDYARYCNGKQGPGWVAESKNGIDVKYKQGPNNTWIQDAKGAYFHFTFTCEGNNCIWASTGTLLATLQIQKCTAPPN